MQTVLNEAISLVLLILLFVIEAAAYCVMIAYVVLNKDMSERTVSIEERSLQVTCLFKIHIEMVYEA